jgi:hypothetical protein
MKNLDTQTIVLIIGALILSALFTTMILTQGFRPW